MVKTTEVERKWITTPEAARMLGVTTQTIRKWIKQGSLEGKKIGSRFFVLKEDLEGVKNDGEQG